MHANSETQLIGEVLNTLWKTMQVMYFYTYRIISKYTYFINIAIVCIAMWQAWLHVHIISKLPHWFRQIPIHFIKNFAKCTSLPLFPKN